MELVNGFFIIECEKKELKKDILQNGPLMTEYVGFFVNEWEPNLSFCTELGKTPMWIRLNNLPTEYWNEEVLSLI
ncbi:hypothetical protein SUGI_0796240 [Cryptomeria japonica]|nr:hypothetical protein SUGI_0796240 [Cryptomeria japonica]